ncbi:aspartate aminotransferase family protein [Sphingosinicella microcystinivorans]|uniref:Aspartate aminotransferase family protein n=1 Tax=Sphingosinicella microcystinivorans TaxID=335406 RepID=A0AAD1G247_SPHMI|nr:aspartate aminotransferase family protein [Sphingosinicella microcystinivorans]RKS86542.1 putrescine aminotransferase [Sphingosinicella microcystinivorans]BBE35354.1 aspartate aminotransferase family protein [Sphingosinicella microcystinivorans]
MTAVRKNYDIPALRRLDVAHHLPAQQDYKLIEDMGGSRIVTHAEGCYITDGDGNRILDGMAGLWCVNIGYGREELADVAAEQMRELPFYNTFFKTATPPTVELAAKIAGLTGGKLQHVFFNASGSEANDTVFRMVRHYWKVKGEPNRKIFISRWNAYHGSTVAGVSLGGMKAMHAQGDLPIPGIEHVRQPYWFGEGRDMEPREFGKLCAQAIEDRILQVGPENVAAFVGEPVQGAGGVIIPPEGYWQEVERICRKYGILLVADEVICGFGRTGEWFGHQTLGFTPDLVPMAKGLSSGYLPISAVAVSSDVVEVLKTGGDFVHGFTYSGHPVCAAVALRNIEIIERENLVGKVRDDVGPYLNAALKRLEEHPLVGETRSIGLLGAVEIVADKKTAARFGGKEGNAGPVVRDFCIDNGLMVRGIRDTIVMSPPLIISRQQIDDLVDIIRRSLDLAMPKLKAL